MVSRLDVILTIGLFPGQPSRGVVLKMGKPVTALPVVRQWVHQLKKDGVVEAKENELFLTTAPKTQKLFRLLHFCLKNKIDYNAVVSKQTAQLVKKGFEQKEIEGLLFDSKTMRRITKPLIKNGFLLVESKKPFVAKIVYSRFLDHLIDYFFEKAEPRHKDLTSIIDEEKLNAQLERTFSTYRKTSKIIAPLDEITFIHTSLMLEGNTLTLPETELVTQKGIPPGTKLMRDAQQMLDYKNALDQFLHLSEVISLENVLSFHRTAMNTLKRGAGMIRKQNVKIKDNPRFATPDWRLVPKQLDELFEKIDAMNRRKKKSAVQIVEEASFLHNEFQRIHPFVDGNSRTARALFAKYALQHGFSLVGIAVGFMDQYMGLTKLSAKRDDKKFSVLMKQIALLSLQTNLQRLESE